MPAFELPGPQQMLEQLNEERGTSYIDADLLKHGREFISGLPWHNINVDGNVARFNSAWAPGHGLAGLAYCTYLYRIPDYDKTAEIHFDWQTIPADEAGLYVGLSHWADNRWVWYAYAGGGVLDADDLAPYFDASGDLLLVVVSTNNDPWELHSIRLGPAPAATDWVHTWGGSAQDELASVAADSKGSVYACGSTEGFGAEFENTLLIKYDATGAFAWARTVDVGRECYLTGVAVSPEGSIFVCGTSQAVSLDRNFLVQRWSPDGQLLWSRLLGGPESDYARGIVATSDAAYVTGYTYRDEVFWNDMVVAKFDHSGTMVTAWRYGQLGSERGSGIAKGTSTTGELELHVIGNQASDLASSDDRPYYVKLDDQLQVKEALAWDSSNETYTQKIAVVEGSPQRVFITGFYEPDGIARIMMLEVLPEGVPVAKTFWLDGKYILGFDVAGLSNQTLVLAGIAPAIGSQSGLVLNTTLDGGILSANCLASEDASINCYAVCEQTDQRVASAHRISPFGQASWEAITMDASAMSGEWAPVLLIAGEWGYQPTVESSTPNEINTGTHDAGAGESEVGVGVLNLEQ
jgi:hypothetical protein